MATTNEGLLMLRRIGKDASLKGDNRQQHDDLRNQQSRSAIWIEAARWCGRGLLASLMFGVIVLLPGWAVGRHLLVDGSAHPKGVLMSNSDPRHMLVAAAGLALTVAACTTNGGDRADTTTLSAPIVEQTTTSAAPATTTTAPTTTVALTTTMSAWDALPPHVKAADWFTSTYESIAYSCEGAGNPDVECDAPHRVDYTRPLIGSEHGADFFDFLGDYDPEAEPFPAHSPYSDWNLTGSVADDPLTGLGHGIRMQQLDRAPPGLNLGGEAWIRLTVSSLSASDHAEATGKLVPTDLGYRIEAGSEGDPIYVRGPAAFPQTQWIESIVLIATNDTMSEWVITFNQPGTYTATASYWTGMAEDYALHIRLVRL